MARTTPALDPTGEPPEEAERALEQAARLLGILRRRWVVVLLAVALALAGALVAIATLQPRWRASATVVLHLSGPQVFDKIKGVSDEGEGRLLAYREYYQTQREILGSRAVAAAALATLGLAEDPVFLGVDRITSEPERLARSAEIDPIERLRELTTIEEIRGSRILKITADYPDPEIAAEIANALTEAYLAHVQRRRETAGTEAKASLTQERETALATLQGAEGAIADFLESHAISSVSLADRQNEITEAVIAETAHLKQAEADYYAASATYDEAKRLHAAGSLASASLLPPLERKIFEEMRSEQLAAERDLEQVSVRYGEKMPEVREAKRRLAVIEGRIQRESEELLRALKARSAAALKTKERHRAALEVEKERALELASLEREYRKLERGFKTADETYGLLAQRDTEIGMTNRLGAEGIELLDRATPPRRPVYPPKSLFLALALVLGLGLGALGALAIDLRDLRIRSLADLERALASFGIPVLGQLPLLLDDARLGVGNLRAQRRQRDLHAFLYPQSLMAERCRGLRTALAFVEGSHPCRTLMVTSPSAGEGKSSITLNLAMSFCQAGKRVLVIDADMRRPRLHQVFTPPAGGEPPGLAAVLAGEAAIDDALIVGQIAEAKVTEEAVSERTGEAKAEARLETGLETRLETKLETKRETKGTLENEDRPANLALLLCGTAPAGPAELLDSPAMRRLLGELRERFDVILLDSPPVLPVIDPVILARLVDGVILVARCQSTSKTELQRAIATLRQGDTNLLGVVLNEVDPRRQLRGYRADYGYYAYGPREATSEG